MTGNRQHAAWRRGREVVDDYDLDRVLTEELADDLVNELTGLRPRRGRITYPGGAAVIAPAVRHPGPGRRPHLRVLRGGLAD